VHPEGKEIWEKKSRSFEIFHEDLSINKVGPFLVDVLQKLNELPGVATLYSCQGHKDERSPMAYVYLVLSSRKTESLRRTILPFLKRAPFFLTVEFEHSIDIHICSQLSTRVKINGDIDHIGEDALPMFYYIYDFLATIGSSRALECSTLEKWLP